MARSAGREESASRQEILTFVPNTELDFAIIVLAGDHPYFDGLLRLPLANCEPNKRYSGHYRRDTDEPQHRRSSGHGESHSQTATAPASRSPS